MDEQQTPNANALDPVEAVAAAMARLGEATAAAIAKEAGQGYSTVTARLRTLEAAGRAEKARGDDRRTYWRLLPATTPPTPTDAPADPSQDAALDGHTAAMSATAAQVSADPDTDTGSASARKHSNDQDVAAPAASALPDEGVPPTLGPPAPPVPAAAAESPAAPAGEADAATTEPAGAEPGAGAAAEPGSADPDGNADEPGAASTPDSPGPETTAATPAQRRPAGHLAKVALSIMRANPDTVYTVTQMTRLIDEADTDLGYSKASQGAVVLALDGLAKKGEAIRLPQDKAQFKLAQQATDAAASQTAAP